MKFKMLMNILSRLTGFQDVSMDEIRVSAECAPNIAVIKYWGKADEDLILPLNGSISATLDREVLKTRTTLVLSKSSTSGQAQSLRIEIEVNGGLEIFDHEGADLKSTDSKFTEPEHKINRKRFLRVLKMIRDNSQLESPYSFDLIKIASQNYFPSACGLASSASGFACLAMCLARAYKYARIDSISELARLGSGSACRSCFGGFVKWSKGTDSASSIATQILASTHWPELNVLVIVFEDAKKKVSSTHGMRETALTSQLLEKRVNLVEHDRLARMESYLKSRDFSQFAKLTIQDSNSFHAACLDTYPPLFYLNDHSRELINLIHEFNKSSIFAPNKSPRAPDESQIKCAYTFDAGPNAFLFVLDDHLNDVLLLINQIYFESQTAEEFIESSVKTSKQLPEISRNYLRAVKNLQPAYEAFLSTLSFTSKAIKYIYHSKIGTDPLICDSL